MKKFGFTLAEVLITLGIIGVISVLTMPTFTQKTQNAKTGPQLGKAASSMENALKAVLRRADVEELISLDLCADGTNTCAERDYAMDDNTGKLLLINIAAFMDGQLNPEQPHPTFLNDISAYYVAKDGTWYGFAKDDWNIENGELANHSVAIPKLIIDLNGIKAPNKNGRDIFYFYVMQDGSLKPWGSSDDKSFYITEHSKPWTEVCPVNEIPTDCAYCAAHIIDNGMKVEYK